MGFGLIEIMVALGLGVVIMLGVTQVATNNSGTRYELDRAGRQMENATFALREMEVDLTNAGYWAEMGTQDDGTLPPVCPTTACDPFDPGPPAAILNDPTSDCDVNRAMRYPLQGGSGAFPCETVEPTVPVDTITPKAASDYIVVRRASSCALGSPGCEAADGDFYLQVHSCFTPGVVSAPLPGINYVIDEIDGAPNTAVFRYKERDASCAAAAAAPHYRFLNRIYYISADDQLMRAELVWNPDASAHQYQQTVLVENVETMRLEYGLDSTGGDGQVDAYTDDPNDPDPTAWINVVMVRISLVVRSAEPSSGYADSKVYEVAGEAYTVPAEFTDHRRKVYTRTVTVRNVAGRRE
jgi:type IV pilus assembly protein PilW